MQSSPSTGSPGSPRARTYALILASAGAGLLALTVALGLASLGGAWVRDGALVPVESPLPDAALTYSDAPDAGRFFEARDTVTVTVPWSMTAAEFLALYHLENNGDARRALRDQQGVRSDADPLARGTQVFFHLTERRQAR